MIMIQQLPFLLSALSMWPCPPESGQNQRVVRECDRLGVVFTFLQTCRGDIQNAENGIPGLWFRTPHRLEDVGDVAQRFGLNASNVDLSAIERRLDFSHLSGLVALSLRSTAITDETFPRLPKNIAVLDLGGNALSNASMKHLAPLKSIVALSVGGSVSDEGISLLASHRHLKELAVHSAEFSGTAFQVKGAFQALEILNASGSSLCDNELAEMAGATNLRYVYVANTRIASRGVRELLKYRAIVSLDASSTNIGNDVLDDIALSITLEEIWLSNTNVSDAGVAKLLKCKSLRRLDLAQTRVDGYGFRNSAESSLTVLDLSYSRVNDEGLAQIGRLQQISELNLAKTSVSHEGIKAIRHLPLRELNLYGSRNISDSAILYLGAIGSLQRLVLTRTAVSDDGIAAIRKLLPACEIE